MAEILCVYRQVAMMRCQAERGESQGQDSDGGSLAIVSYDEKPGMQAIATTAPDRPPLPGVSPTVMRDHEYKRCGTLNAGRPRISFTMSPTSMRLACSASRRASMVL